MQRANELTSRAIPQMAGQVEHHQRECAKHGEYQAITREVNGQQHESMCPQCLAEVTEEESMRNSIAIDQQRRQTQSKSLAELLGYSGIPKRFISRGFDTFDARNNELASALQKCRTYAETFGKDLHHGQGLLMIGKTGTGKTHLAASICKAVIRSGYNGLFISTLNVIQLVKETYRRDADCSEREAIARFVEPDLLVLDEVGVQHNTRTEQIVLTEIINRRYESEKPTILLSNLQVESQTGQTDLVNVLGERVISRLREVNELLVFNSEDYRSRP